MAAASLRFDAAEKRLVRAVLTMTAAADLIRAAVRNRFDNVVRGTSVAIHRRRRSDRSRAVLPPLGCRGANSRSATARPPSLIHTYAMAHRAGRGAATCSRR